MTTRLEAVYENGVFRPLTRPEGVAEHGRVTLTVTAEEHPASLADLGGRISAGDASRTSFRPEPLAPGAQRREQGGRSR